MYEFVKIDVYNVIDIILFTQSNNVLMKLCAICINLVLIIPLMMTNCIVCNGTLMARFANVSLINGYIWLYRPFIMLSLHTLLQFLEIG